MKSGVYIIPTVLLPIGVFTKNVTKYQAFYDRYRAEVNGSVVQLKILNFFVLNDANAM